MHATLAYLNAAGRRTTRSTSRNWAFIRVMDSLLANVHALPMKTLPPRAVRRKKALPFIESPH